MSSPSPDRQERFSRQMRIPEIGAAGQERLAAATVAVMGVGATGGAIAMQLARAGVGSLRLIDRDFVELSNLPRQVLFGEADLDPPRPKAVAAADALRAIDSELELEAIVADVTSENVRKLIQGVDLVMDGSDNFQLRYLVNDACIDAGLPFVYCGAVGTLGQMLPVFPGRTACLACWIPEPPPASELARCDTHGVLGPAVVTVSGLAAAAALRILLRGEEAAGLGRLQFVELWEARVGELAVRRREDCRACARRDLVYLRGEAGGEAVRMCGREAVQISAPARAPDLQVVAEMLEETGDASLRVQATPHLLTIACPPHRLLLFRDGRAIVEGTTEPQAARELVQRLVGM